MKKINESTKVMLTLKQLRQLVKEASNRLAKDTIYIVKINPEYLKMRVKSWKEVSDDPVYKALAQAFDMGQSAKRWTILEALPYETGPERIPTIKKAKKKAEQYERADKSNYYAVVERGAIRPFIIPWMSENLDNLRFDKEEEEDADVITDTDFAEVVDELEYYLLDNEGCADLKDDSGIEKFREKVVYPAVNAFFNAGKTVEDKEEIMDFVKGKPNPYKFYRDKDPYEDG